jgi:hypothetical protein
MAQNIKAIETRYHGFRFRSRLEARYAVFFDTLGVKWEYEKEGFDLGVLGWYLPDFFLPYHADWTTAKFPNAGVWLEVKGEMPTAEEKQKLLCLSQMTKHSGRLVVGMPGENKIYSTHYTGHYQWLDDADTRSWKITFAQHIPYPIDTNKIEKAIYAARGARFEHGEGGY